MIEREIKRLEIRLGGVRTMKVLPNLVFVVDVSREYTAVHEANLVGIPVLALVDTNCDPSGVDYVIPSNDDAIRAIKLLVGKIAEAVLEGKAMRKDDILAEEAAAALPQTTPLRSRYAEDELDEGDLLGDATLAKLGGAPHVAEEEIEEEAVTEEAVTEEAVAEEAAEVPVAPEVEPDTTVDQN